MSGSSGNATRIQVANPSPVKRGRRLPYCLLFIALLIAAATVTEDVSTAFPIAHTRSKNQWAQMYAALPLSFEANLGQTDPAVNFISKGKGYSLFLTNHEAVLTLKSPSVAPPSVVAGKTPPKSEAKAGSTKANPGSASAESTLRMELVGANSAAKITGTEELPGKANYFIGNNPSKWRTNVPTYAKVRYEGVYPGIDLVYYGTVGGELEYDFVVKPGADPSAIGLGIDSQGRSRLQLNAKGNLIVGMKGGDLEFHKPVVYQPGLGGTSVAELRTPVEAHYFLDAQNHVRFECGNYDRTRDLVIDPVLVYSTYVGGSGGDIGYAITVDSTHDNAYIAGTTSSTDFPLTTTPGVRPFQGTDGGTGDAFVTQINSAGTALVYSTYVGGTGSDTATAIALFNSDVYITGYTTSSDFPVTAPSGAGPTVPFQQFFGGNTDAFVFELDQDGSELTYSSYLGGNGADFGQGIAVDSSGDAYVVGTTQSSNFQVVKPIQASLKGGQNVFVLHGSKPEKSSLPTHLGGSSADTAVSSRLTAATTS